MICQVAARVDFPPPYKVPFSRYHPVSFCHPVTRKRSSCKWCLRTSRRNPQKQHTICLYRMIQPGTFNILNAPISTSMKLPRWETSTPWNQPCRRVCTSTHETNTTRHLSWQPAWPAILTWSSSWWRKGIVKLSVADHFEVVKCLMEHTSVRDRLSTNHSFKMVVSCAALKWCTCDR